MNTYRVTRRYYKEVILEADSRAEARDKVNKEYLMDHAELESYDELDDVEEIDGTFTEKELTT